MATATKKAPAKRGAATKKTAKKATAKKTTTVKKAPTKKVSRPRPLLDDKGLREAEAELREKCKEMGHPANFIVKGSLRNIGDDPDKNPAWKTKRTVEIRCTHPGCKETRRVATSDLHQVTMCVEHTLEARLARRRESRKAKAEKPR